MIRVVEVGDEGSVSPVNYGWDMKDIFITTKFVKRVQN